MTQRVKRRRPVGSTLGVHSGVEVPERRWVTLYFLFFHSFLINLYPIYFTKKNEI
ncbi:MAG: hypothetical protein Q8S84_01425 [bacterium]|nr:hypothetical protein [bacterium]MDP3380230.1 hypothetical protein [bacterium]